LDLRDLFGLFRVFNVCAVDRKTDIIKPFEV
jgi:hypothetical protein